MKKIWLIALLSITGISTNNFNFLHAAQSAGVARPGYQIVPGFSCKCCGRNDKHKQAQSSSPFCNVTCATNWSQGTCPSQQPAAPQAQQTLAQQPVQQGEWIVCAYDQQVVQNQFPGSAFCKRGHLDAWRKAYPGQPLPSQQLATPQQIAAAQQQIAAAQQQSAAQSGNAVKFYVKGEPYYEFTNFYLTSVTIKGFDVFPMSEAAFQFFKFIHNQKIKDEILVWFKSKTPKQAYDDIQKISQTEIHPQWHSMKLYVLYAVVKAKFTQNQVLLQHLCGTRNKEIIEDTAKDTTRNDPYWGNAISQGKVGQPPFGTPGLNYLGKILMKVRNELCGSSYPVLQLGTTGSIAEFEQELNKHYGTWMQTIKQPIVDGITGTPFVVGAALQPAVMQQQQQGGAVGVLAGAVGGTQEGGAASGAAAAGGGGMPQSAHEEFTFTGFYTPAIPKDNVEATPIFRDSLGKTFAYESLMSKLFCYYDKGFGPEYSSQPNLPKNMDELQLWRLQKSLQSLKQELNDLTQRLGILKNALQGGGENCYST